MNFSPSTRQNTWLFVARFVDEAMWPSDSLQLPPDDEMKNNRKGEASTDGQHADRPRHLALLPKSGITTTHPSAPVPHSSTTHHLSHIQQSHLTSNYKLNHLLRNLPHNCTTMSQPAAAGRWANRKPVPPPVPAYLPTAGSPLTVDKELYKTIREAPRVLVKEFTLPIRSGRAWEVPAGAIVNISTPEGPQVGM